MPRHDVFWLIQLTILNLISVVLYACCMPAFFPGNCWTIASFLVAFLLQLPFFWVFYLSHLALLHVFKRLRGGVYFFLTGSIILEFLFLSIYISSQSLFMRFYTFASFESISIIFTDTLQVFPLLVEQHTLEVVGVIILSAGLTLVYQKFVFPRESPSGWKARGLVQALALVLFVGAYLLLEVTSVFPLRVRQAIIERTFPSVYALPLLGEESRMGYAAGEGSAPKDGLKAADLAAVISMDEYKKSNPALRDKPQVFILMLEAISSDHVGFNGYRRAEITPNIDAFSKESLVFVNAFSASNHSNYAQTSFHSSQWALRRTHLDLFENIDYHKTLLSDILAAYGYQTVFISAQNEDWQGMKTFTLHNSTFDHYYHSKDALGDGIGAERKIDDALVIDEAIRTLKSADPDRPVYMYLNLQRTHFPYRLNPGAPRPYAPNELTGDITFFHYPEEKIETVVNRYDNALRYVDGQVGRFLDFLKERGLFEQAIIVITADHGEAFYQKGYPTHGTSLFDDQVKTFLLFKTPGSQVTGLRQDAVSLIDVNPSILELLNLRNHPNFQGAQIIARNEPGRDLYMTSQGLIEAHGVVRYPWKFIKSKKEGERLINLELDPIEKKDYSEDFPEERDELETALNRYINSQLLYYNILTPKQRDSRYPPKL